MRQLILDLIPDTPPTLENFTVGSNAEALTGLMAWLAPENNETCLYLWGDSGAGKTHLLCAVAPDRISIDAASDPTLGALADHTAPSSSDLVVIDNVEALDADGQITLFNQFNRLRAVGGRLLVSAQVPPRQLVLREDLRTRLGSGLIFRLHPLSETEKLAALAEQAEKRGLRLPRESLDYLLARAPRDMRSLSSLLTALDRYSLEHKRPVTLPLLREVLHAPRHD